MMFGVDDAAAAAPLASPNWFGTLQGVMGLTGMLLFMLVGGTPALPPAQALEIIATTQRFPASFGDLWYSFALALFATLTMTSVSLGMIVENVRTLRQTKMKWDDPAHIYLRIQMAGFLVFVLGAGGDALSLLVWGDVSARTLELILAVDRYMDFCCVVPFLYYVWLRTRSLPVHLVYLHMREDGNTRPSFPMVRRNLAMVGTCLFAALVVALTK